MPEQAKPREEYALVLDFLPHGYPFDTRPSHLKSAIAQAMGKGRFSLLELVPRKDIHLQPHEEVYIGEGKRDKIHHVTGKIPITKLTQTAQSELSFIIKEEIKKHPERFIAFFNDAQPLSMRMHALELLPGLGKKHMWEIVEERKGKPFASFSDLKKRVKLMPDPEKAVYKRIMLELEGKEKHHLFVDR